MGTYKLREGDRDCSASVIDALRTAGIPTGNASYTGNMKSEFLKTGAWKWHPMSDTAHRGDVYLKAGSHTAMCSYPLKGKTTPDMLLEFSHNEVNGYWGGKVGDQLNDSGYRGESHSRTYYDYPWDGFLEYIGSRQDLLEDAVQLMEHLVSCPKHGYTMSDPGRNGSGGYCTVTTTGTPNDGWSKVGSDWVYRQNGELLKNRWVKDKVYWYYLGADGKMVRGWLSYRGKKYYLRTKKEGIYPDGSMVVGKYMIPTEYTFNPDGDMVEE